MGIGLAMTVSNLVAVLGRTVGLRRTLHGLDGRRIVQLYVKVSLAAIVAAVIGYLALTFLGRAVATVLTESSFAWSVTVTVVVGIAMTVVYAGGLRIMRVREFDDLIRPIARRLGRGR